MEWNIDEEWDNLSNRCNKLIDIWSPLAFYAQHILMVTIHQQSYSYVS